MSTINPSGGSCLSRWTFSPTETVPMCALVNAALASKPGNQVIVPGGLVNTDDLAFTSSSVVDAIRAMHFDVAVFGSCAADPGTGLTVASWSDAQMKRAALKNSQRAVLVATADKFSRTAAHHFGALAELDAVVTTSEIGTVFKYEIQQLGVRVLWV